MKISSNQLPVLKPPLAEVPPIKKKLDMKESKYRKIFVGGLPHNLHQEDFAQYFSHFGPMEDCVILKDK